MIVRAEKPGMIQEVGKGWLNGVHSNVARPSMLMITNRSPLLQKLFTQAINNYTISSADFIYTDPAADEVNFHPPYFDEGLISAGWATGTRYYHTTADGENNLVSATELEKMGRAYSYIIDQLESESLGDLDATQCESRCRFIGHGLYAKGSVQWTHVSQRSRQPLCQQIISSKAVALPHETEHEPQRKLLGHSVTMLMNTSLI